MRPCQDEAIKAGAEWRRLGPAILSDRLRTDHPSKSRLTTELSPKMQRALALSRSLSRPLRNSSRSNALRVLAPLRPTLSPVASNLRRFIHSADAHSSSASTDEVALGQDSGRCVSLKPPLYTIPDFVFSELSTHRYHVLSDRAMESLLESLEGILDDIGDSRYEVEYSVSPSP